MSYRNNISIGFIILSIAVLIHSLHTASASMPVGMQHGQFPYEHFTECDLPGATTDSSRLYCQYTYSSSTSHTLLTVPSDRIFVITGASIYQSRCNFTSAGVPLIGGNLIEGYNNYSGQSPVGNGNANLVLQPGSTLEVYMRSSHCPFYVEGYYAHI